MLDYFTIQDALVKDRVDYSMPRFHCLVCVLCVQVIARLQSELLDPSISEGYRTV